MIRAQLYDGRTSGAHAAEVTISAAAGSGRLLVRAGDLEINVPLTDLRIGERVGTTHRLLQLPERRSLEILDNAECYQLMQDFIKTHAALWDEDIGEAY